MALSLRNTLDTFDLFQTDATPTCEDNVVNCHQGIGLRPEFQRTVSFSYSKSNFIAASGAGKMPLFLRNILDSFDLSQTDATPTCEDYAANCHCND